MGDEGLVACHSAYHPIARGCTENDAYTDERGEGCVTNTIVPLVTLGRQDSIVHTFLVYYGAG